MLKVENLLCLVLPLYSCGSLCFDGLPIPHVYVVTNKISVSRITMELRTISNTPLA